MKNPKYFLSMFSQQFHQM